MTAVECKAMHHLAALLLMAPAEDRCYVPKGSALPFVDPIESMLYVLLILLST